MCMSAPLSVPASSSPTPSDLLTSDLPTSDLPTNEPSSLPCVSERSVSERHQAYADSVAKRLVGWLRRKSRSLPKDWLDAGLVLLRLDLEGARALLEALYSPDPRGKKPYDPVCMLRALLLMLLLRQESLPKFVDKLQHTPRLARIAGFQPDAVPVAGTFYLFLDRLEDGPYTKPCPATCPHAPVQASALRKGKHRRNLKTEKEQRHEDTKRNLSEHDSVTHKLKAELEATADQPRPRDLQQRLEDILFLCGVIPSAQRGLLGNVSRLSVVGDGSALETSASPHGKPTCTCRKQGNYHCDCDRFYTDPTADWGYDSYRDVYYFGHTYYQHVVSTNGHDLPLHVGIGPASETDFTLSLKSLDRLRKGLQEQGLDWKIQHTIYDCGHDATGIYEYLDNADSIPIIELNPRTGEHAKPTGTAQHVNDDGIPLCPAGLTMRRCSHDPKKHRIYFNCPVKRPTHQDGKHSWNAHVQECPLGCLCQPDTKMSPVVYIKTDDDPRLYPPIPRHSPRFKTLMKLRSGCERSNSMKKKRFRLDHRVCRNASHFLMRLGFASLLEHAKAWLAEDKKRLGDDPVALIVMATASPTANPNPTREPMAA